MKNNLYRILMVTVLSVSLFFNSSLTYAANEVSANISELSDNSSAISVKGKNNDADITDSNNEVIVHVSDDDIISNNDVSNEKNTDDIIVPASDSNIISDNEIVNENNIEAAGYTDEISEDECVSEDTVSDNESVSEDGVYTFGLDGIQFMDPVSDVIGNDKVIENFAEINCCELEAAGSAVYADKYDARDDGLCTGVKDQGSYGTCSAFAETVCLENYMIKHGLKVNGITCTKDNTDVSERAIFSYNYANAKSFMYQTTSIITGLALTAEATYPYERPFSLNWTNDWFKDGRQVNPVYSDSIARITDKYEVNIENKAEVKAAVLNNGGVEIAFNLDKGKGNQWKCISGKKESNTYYNANKYIQYGHAVTIVGWDDNFDFSSYTYDSNPGNGAWLCKNSWGIKWGTGKTGTNEADEYLKTNTGYFWMAYENPTTSRIGYTYTVEETDSNTNYYN